MLFRALEENRIYEQNLHNHRALLRRLAEKIGGELTAEIEEFLARPIDWDTSKDTREK